MLVQFSWALVVYLYINIIIVINVCFGELQASIDKAFNDCTTTGETDSSEVSGIILLDVLIFCYQQYIKENQGTNTMKINKNCIKLQTLLFHDFAGKNWRKKKTSYKPYKYIQGFNGCNKIWLHGDSITTDKLNTLKINNLHFTVLTCISPI